MTYLKNGEGYTDNVPAEAIKNASKMPKHITEVFKALNGVASMLGVEIIEIRDRTTKRRWRKYG